MSKPKKTEKKQPAIYVNGEKQEGGVVTKRATRKEREAIAVLLKKRNQGS